MGQTITEYIVELGERSYPIRIGEKLLDQAGEQLAACLPSKRVIIITDRNVAEHHLSNLKRSLDAAGFAHNEIIVPAGEKSKSFARFEQVMEDVLALKPDRKTALIALGGGVIGDLCGFVASVLLRGVPFVQIPTSLLAQVDSSVGGKTAINSRAGKNLVGSFYQPQLVLIDTATLITLPDRELKSGYAEVIKYGMIVDREFFDWLCEHQSEIMLRDQNLLAKTIEVCCRLKAGVVSLDERESGIRAILNLGHTFGHALEAETSFSDTLLHGEAVAIGMVMAARLSHKLGLCDEAIKEQLKEQLDKAGLATSPKQVRDKWDIDSICGHFLADKKTEDGMLTFVALHDIGKAEILKMVNPAIVREVVEEFVS